VVVSRLMPRSAAETVTSALATVAPDESRTVPVTEAESWAWRSVAENNVIAKTILFNRRMFIRGSLEASNCGKTAAEEKHRSRLESEINFCCGMFSARRQFLGIIDEMAKCLY
jgi:hypothetical protein